MVVDRKTNFFLEKDGFGVKNHLFLRENQKNNLFGVWPHSVSVFLVFRFSLGKSWFPSQNHLFLGKSWFSCPEPSFLGKS